MTDAYVLITTEPSSVMHAATEVDEIDEVTTVHVVTGEYDLIAQLDLDEPEDLPTVVAEKIREAPPIRSTYTLVAYEPTPPDSPGV
jgi:DNA-binding Lrp family transcriptional regulator